MGGVTNARKQIFAREARLLQRAESRRVSREKAEIRSRRSDFKRVLLDAVGLQLADVYVISFK